MRTQGVNATTRTHTSRLYCVTRWRLVKTPHAQHEDGIRRGFDRLLFPTNYLGDTFRIMSSGPAAAPTPCISAAPVAANSPVSVLSPPRYGPLPPLSRSTPAPHRTTASSSADRHDARSRDTVPLPVSTNNPKVLLQLPVEASGGTGMLLTIPDAGPNHTYAVDLANFVFVVLERATALGHPPPCPCQPS